MKDLLLRARVAVEEPQIRKFYVVVLLTSTRSKIAPKGSWLRQNQKCNVDYSQLCDITFRKRRVSINLDYKLSLTSYYIFSNTLASQHWPIIWEATWHSQCLQFELDHLGRWIEFPLELAQQVSIIFTFYKEPNP